MDVNNFICANYMYIKILIKIKQEIIVKDHEYKQMKVRIGVRPILTLKLNYIKIEIKL